MRNLAISSVFTWVLPKSGSIDPPQASKSASITFDLDEKCTYCAVERAPSELSAGEDGNPPKVTLIKVQAGCISDEQLPTYTSTELVPETYPRDAPFVLSFHFLPESRNLVLILANGEIVIHPADSSDLQWDVVGAFEGGLEAAKWSPDDSLLMLATSDGKLVQMTANFETLHEKQLRTSEFGEDAQVNVNWGSKATQFHGSLGKAAATADSQILIGSSPDDDARVRISWRGDAAHFAVSTLDRYENVDTQTSPQFHRVIRVYDRDVTLQSTLEPTAGLEHCLAWRPSGNFLATSQRFFPPDSGFLGGALGRHGRHDVVFFERNGLRRLEFDGQWIKQGKSTNKGDQWSYKIKEMGWSCDSNVLAIWVSRRAVDVVQLWTTGNWHWYLKFELTPPSSPRLLSIAWHPEQPRTLLLVSESSLFEYNFEYDTVTSLGGPPSDLGMVAVVDKGNALITPFRMQNVPPPSAAHTIQLNEQSIPPVYMCISPSAGWLLSMHQGDERGTVLRLWHLNPRRTPGRGKILNPVELKSQHVELLIPYQALITEATNGDLLVSVLGHGSSNKGSIIIFRVSDDIWTEELSVVCEANGRLLQSGDRDSDLIWQSSNGSLLHVRSMEPVSSFPEFCFYGQAIFIGSARETLFIGLSSRSRLYATSFGKEPIIINAAVTSFVVAGSFLIYLTTAHESVYAPLTDIASALSLGGVPGDSQNATDKIAALSSTWEKRRVERGSRIVTAVPSAMNVVLQMPRGNLETINPRPLALEVIRSDIARLKYGEAFSACRKHRIDLNILVEQAPSVFLNNIPVFLNQVPQVDDLNLFLTAIGRSKTHPELVAKVCSGIRQELKNVDPIKYVQTILTSFVVQSPPDYEEALCHLHKLREHQSAIIEEAVRYIIFLVDADKLFDIALGMYDFTLVLLIAQHSQRDPREYLPFLRELKALDSDYQKFRIDDHLKRYSKALRHLFEGGSPRFSEALRYVDMHQLYDDALELWKAHEEEHRVIMESYGDWMFDRRDFGDAALAYETAKKTSKAMMAYEKAHSWRPLFYLATQSQLAEEKVAELAYRVAEDLATRKRWADAGAVYLDYAADIEEAVRAFTNGNELAEALRVAAKQRRPDLIDTVIHPGAIDLSSQMHDDLEEMDEQLKKQHNRLQELRRAKFENPDAFFGSEDLSLHNVDVKTDISTPFTTFTQYTVAPTSTSRSISGRTSRSKRKLDMKNAAGRRGTAEEETYIMASWSKLTTRLTLIQAEAAKLLPHLLLFSEEHREEGKKLQTTILNFQEEFKRMIDEIWLDPIAGPPTNGESTASESIPNHVENSGKTVPPKPMLGPQAWAIRFWS